MTCCRCTIHVSQTMPLYKTTTKSKYNGRTRQNQWLPIFFFNLPENNEIIFEYYFTFPFDRGTVVVVMVW